MELIRESLSLNMYKAYAKRAEQRDSILSLSDNNKLMLLQHLTQNQDNPYFKQMLMQFLWPMVFLGCYLGEVTVNAVTLPNLKLVDNCPTRYNIKGSGNSPLQIEVKNDKNSCERIGDSTDPDSYTTTSDLSPTLTIGSYGNVNVLNISWPSTIKDKKHPKWFLLQLTKYEQVGTSYRDSTCCLLLRIRNRKIDTQKKPPRLYFDCIELYEDPTKIYLSVQIWSLPSMGIIRHRCQDRLRGKRSVPMSNTCVMGQLQCSEREMFSLSLNEHMSSICHCSSRPKLSIERLDNSSLEIDIWDLPQFAYTIKVWIREGNDIVYNESLTGTEGFKERRTLITDRAFGPGNYTPEVYAMCTGDEEDIRKSGKNCPLMDVVQLEQALEVKMKVKPVKPPKNKLPDIVSILSILGAVVLSCLVTSIVFCAIRRHRKGTQSASETLMTFNSQCNDNFNERFVQIAKQTSEKMLLYHNDSNDHIKAINTLQELGNHCGIQLVTEGALNWRDFAEMAGSHFTEIVIILSLKLLQLCTFYKNQSRDRDWIVFNELLKERHYENIPSVVLHKLQILTQQTIDSCTFSVHIVSFEPDNDLVEEFIETFDFLKRGSNCFFYNLSLNIPANKHQDSHTEINEKSLHLLLSRLKGVTENDEMDSQIEEAICYHESVRQLSDILIGLDQKLQ